MAAPPEVTIGDLSGVWVMNKTLSDDTDSILALQGIGWFMRKAISLATVTLYIKQYTDPATGHTHIDIDSTATGGIKGTTELRELDWEPREHDDHIFGHLKGKSRWITPDMVDDEFLKEGWIESDEEKGGPEGQRLLQSFVENEKAGWTGNQTWGFAVVDGQRYYTRRVIITKGNEVKKVRLVYNWQGKQQ